MQCCMRLHMCVRIVRTSQETSTTSTQDWCAIGIAHAPQKVQIFCDQNNLSGRIFYGQIGAANAAPWQSCELRRLIVRCLLPRRPSFSRKGVLRARCLGGPNPSSPPLPPGRRIGARSGLPTNRSSNGRTPKLKPSVSGLSSLESSLRMVANYQEGSSL